MHRKITEQEQQAKEERNKDVERNERFASSIRKLDLNKLHTIWDIVQSEIELAEERERKEKFFKY